MKNSETHYVIKFGDYYLEKIHSTHSKAELYLSASESDAIKFNSKEKANRVQRKIKCKVVKIRGGDGQ